MNLADLRNDDAFATQYRFEGAEKLQLPIHLQLVERREYMRKKELYEQTTSLLPASTPSSSSSGLDEESPFLGKHRYSTYYERLPFFKNPFSPNNKRAQKLLYTTSHVLPEATKFALVHDDKWLVYGITNDEPSLLCCGKLSGDHGPNFDTLGHGIGFLLRKGAKYKLCSLSERLLVLVLTDGLLRVHDILDQGRTLYHYEAGLQIESVDISPKNNVIACGLQGRNKQTRGSIMLLITLELQKSVRGFTSELMGQDHSLDFAPPQRGFLRKIGSKPSLKNIRKISEAQTTPELQITKADTKLITLPYKGIVDTVRFSQNGSRLTFLTHKTESKFIVFDVSEPSKIQLLMKLSRTPDSNLGSEGITDFELFGDDQFMLIASNSPRAPPMILDTNIRNHTGKPVQPRRLLRIDGVGTNIQKCCINSTHNLAAFLSADGKLFLAQLGVHKGKYSLIKVELIDQVSGSSCYKNCASMRFSKDGSKMYIVDLQGVMFVQDFSALLTAQ